MDGEVKQVALELQPCCGSRSGIGVYTYELATRLRNGDGMTFHGNLFNFLGRNDNRAALEGIDMPITERHMFPYGIYRRVWNWLPIPYAMFFPERADLTIFFNYIVPPRISGRVITTVCDMTYLRCPETMNKRNLKRILDGIDYSVKRSSRVVTISEFSKREIVELLGVPEEKVRVVPSAPNISEDMIAFEDVKAKFGIEKPYILYVGNLEPRKNLVRLLEAFARLKAERAVPHRLVLAGGRGWNNEDFDRALAGHPCRGDIILTGYVTSAEKNALYRFADVFVFPSLYEGFGIPPLEAMHWGCPVVAADAASLPEVVGDAAALVDPLDPESIAEGLWRVLGDPEYARRLRDAGLRQAKKYTWDDSARRLLAVCAEVLNE